MMSKGHNGSLFGAMSLHSEARAPFCARAPSLMMARYRTSHPAGRRIRSVAVCIALLIQVVTPVEARSALAIKKKRKKNAITFVAQEDGESTETRKFGRKIEAPVPRSKEQREALSLIPIAEQYTSENDHTEAIRYYQRALELISGERGWEDVETELKGRLAHSYERWYQVVGDEEDLRKALVYATGYLNGLPVDDVQELDFAQARVDRLKAELAKDGSGLDSLEKKEEEASFIPKPIRNEQKPAIKPKAISLPSADIVQSRRKLRTTLISVGSVGWVALAGTAVSGYLYSNRFRKAFDQTQLIIDGKGSDKTPDHVNTFLHQGDMWRTGAVIGGLVTVVCFSVVTALMITSTRSRRAAKSVRAKKKQRKLSKLSFRF